MSWERLAGWTFSLSCTFLVGEAGAARVPLPFTGGAGAEVTADWVRVLAGVLGESMEGDSSLSVASEPGLSSLASSLSSPSKLSTLAWILTLRLLEGTALRGGRKGGGEGRGRKGD